MAERLSRQQIARIVNNDQEAIRVFESLLRTATQEQPDEIIALRADIEGQQQAPDAPNGLEALAWLARIEDRLDGAAYARIVKTADQVAGAINTAEGLIWNTATASGISLGTPASRIVFAKAGTYRLDLTVQIASSTAAAKNIWLWLAVNGTDIAGSAAIETEAASGARAVVTRSDMIMVAAGDYAEVKLAVDDVALFVNAEAATAFAPATSSAVAVITQVRP
jgi:hypothetical protein